MRPLLKFCGNHSFEDLKKAMASRSDFIGLIFTSKSRRMVSPNQAAEWLSRLEQKEKKKLVGVFADDSSLFVQEVLQKVPLDLLQFHGNETLRFLDTIKSATGLPVWKALHHDSGGIERMRSFAGDADGYVIDTKVKGKLGGTGLSFDWENVPQYMEEAERQQVNCFIAGGVSPDNIDRLLKFHPKGIDLASGIERNFHKDNERIRKIEEKVWMNHDQAASTGS